MSLDFAYLKTHIPIMGDIQQILLAVGWALLLGNLVFQALRSMASGLGFEGEDPKLLFARTFVFRMRSTSIWWTAAFSGL